MSDPGVYTRPWTLEVALRGPALRINPFEAAGLQLMHLNGIAGGETARKGEQEGTRGRLFGS